MAHYVRISERRRHVGYGPITMGARAFAARFKFHELKSEYALTKASVFKYTSLSKGLVSSLSLLYTMVALTKDEMMVQTKPNGLRGQCQWKPNQHTYTNTHTHADIHFFISPKSRIVRTTDTRPRWYFCIHLLAWCASVNGSMIGFWLPLKTLRSVTARRQSSVPRSDHFDNIILDDNTKYKSIRSSLFIYCLLKCISFSTLRLRSF